MIQSSISNKSIDVKRRFGVLKYQYTFTLCLPSEQYLTLKARKNSPISNMTVSTLIKGSVFILAICYFHTCHGLKCYAGDKVGFEDVSSKDCDKACKNVTKRMLSRFYYTK